MSLSNFPLLFLQASITTLLASSLAWALLHLARRRWPALAAQRSPWLAALLAGVLTLVLVMLPGAAQLSLFAAAPQSSGAGPASSIPLLAAMDLLPGGSDDLSADETLPTLAWLWLAMYLAGGAWQAWRWQRVRRQLQALAGLAQRLDSPALSSHPAFSGHRGPLPPVLEIDAPVSPMLAGLVHPVLLLPRHMRDLPAGQQALILAHELAHLRRRDHLWQHAAGLLQAILWFVPAAHSLRHRLQWALELGCDRAVLAGRPASERRHYAAALLAQLGVQVRAGAGLPQAMGPASLAFGLHGGQAVAQRIRLIRDAQPAPHASWAGMAALLLLPGLCGASVLLQPQFAWNQAAPAAPSMAVGAPAQASAAAWQAPLARLRVTSAFGSVNRPGGKPHGGMDLGAARGTPVMAPAAGRVAVSTDRYTGGARYGKVVVLEHGDGTSSLYAHLDTRLVQAGDMVRAGQQIARTGATGKVTGPHLHFEVARHGANIDPQALLGSAPH